MPIGSSCTRTSIYKAAPRYRRPLNANFAETYVVTLAKLSPSNVSDYSPRSPFLQAMLVTRKSGTRETHGGVIGEFYYSLISGFGARLRGSRGKCISLCGEHRGARHRGVIRHRREKEDAEGRKAET